MFERLSTDDMSNALAELIAWFGIKEEVPFHQLRVLLREKNTEACVQEIATRLDLPVHIKLSYVPENFRPGNTDGFRSSALSRTDWTGRAIESITAQVSIPQHLPMFGTSALQGFQVQVRVSENCREHPETFVAMIAHELSHVLLASLHHPQKDSELHTDLVPIMLGFGNIIRKGRKTIQSTTSGNTTTTTLTSTYGYLTDSQFDFAYNHVTAILQHHQRAKRRLIEVAGQVQRKLNRALRSLERFRDYFNYLDKHPPKKMTKGDANRAVQLHSRDYSSDWESRIAIVRASLKGAESFARGLSHYTSTTVEHLKAHIKELESASDEIEQVTEAIAKDERILRRYVGFIYRLRRTLWHRSSSTQRRSLT